MQLGYFTLVIDYFSKDNTRLTSPDPESRLSIGQELPVFVGRLPKSRVGKIPFNWESLTPNILGLVQNIWSEVMYLK